MMNKPVCTQGLILIMVFIILSGCGTNQSTKTNPTIPVIPSRDVVFTSSVTPSLPVETQLPSTAAFSETPTFTTKIPTKSAKSDPTNASIEDALIQLEDLPMDEFFEESFRMIQLRDPDQLFINGLAEQFGVPNDTFSNLSDAYLQETQQLESGILNLLLNYERETLTSDLQRSFDVYQWLLEEKVRGHAFIYYDYPINPLTIWGKQNWLIDFMINYQPVQDIRDAEDYIARLSKIDSWMNQLMEGLKRREQAGIIPPKYVIQGAINQVDDHLHRRGSDSFHIEGIELYSSFREKLDTVEEISPHEVERLLKAARVEIESSFIPAYQALEEYLINLKSKAGNISGYQQFPNGEEYYAYIFRQQTGSDIAPQQAHDLGLSEVKRLQTEILQVAYDNGYPEDITLVELQERLSSESDVLVGDPLLSEYGRLIAEAEDVSRLFFESYPSSGLILEEEPFGSGIGYYLPPPLDGSSPGKFYMNPEIPMPSYLIPTYIFHETIPGHHLQGSLTRELELPMFRKLLELNGYMEGWAVYAERLAWEMGLYQNDPQGNLGRLLFELSRAARLVIDTGIHNKAWSRQDAADYYQEATGSPASPEAMDRYVILPGQGCGYTIGMREILDLRQRAMDRLGDEFDINAFHHIVLGSGNLPFHILREVVDDWINTATR